MPIIYNIYKHKNKLSYFKQKLTQSLIKEVDYFFVVTAHTYTTHIYTQCQG